MTVFRTYLKVMNRCKMPIIVYTVILLVFSWFHISMGDDPTDFVSEKPDIYVKNLGGETEFTEHLTSYLEKYFVIDDIKDEGDGINDALFYRDVNYVIFIPADYSTRIIEGNEPEVSVKSVGNYAASYAGMILEEYLQTVDKCMSVSQPGSSINEALDKTDKILGTDSKVEVTGSLDMNRMQMAADYYNFANIHLNEDIRLGYHAHNNFQLGYTNTISVLEYKTKRSVLVDGTLYGMGKSAGNAPLELIAMYMNEHCGKQYKITEMQEAITDSVMDFQKKSPWGYQLFYYIAASNKVHPNYVSYLMNKRTLSVTAVNEILKKLPDDQKLEKNMKLIEQLYMDYQKNECDDRKDIKKLSGCLKGRKLLVIGPGSSIGTYEKDIQKFINEEYPIIISINYIPMQFRPDYMFTTNARRYVQSVSKLHDIENSDIKIIASSNLAKSERNFDFVINYSSLIDETAEFPDNSMCMLIRTLIRCGCKSVVLAGLDGYTVDSVNYYDVDKEYSFLKEKAASLNDYAIKFFNTIADRIQVSFLTPSKYQKG